MNLNEFLLCTIFIIKRKIKLFNFNTIYSNSYDITEFGSNKNMLS